MELEGSLRAFSLAEILQFLAMGKLTGTLMVRQERKGIDLVIRQGRIVNSKNLDLTRRLGQMLISRRMIHRSDLDDVLREQRTTHSDKRLGQLLVERALITMDDLREVIRSQLEEEIWELFSWESGDFRFEHRKESEIQGVLVEIEIEPLIIEGTRRIDEWKAIVRNLKGDNTVLGVQPWKREEHPDLTLTPTEWQVLACVNGRSTISSIVAHTGIGKFETYRILNKFLVMGIVHIKDERPPATAERRSQQPMEVKPEAESTTWAGRLRQSLFGGKGSDAATGFAQKEQFSTPLGLAARFIDLVVSTCFAHRDFHFAAGDERFLEQTWNTIVMDCPMADLLRVEGNRIDVSPIERYLEVGGITNLTLRVYEDAIEGLQRLSAATMDLICQRMGDRPLQRVVQTLQEKWLPGIQIERQVRFDFADFVGRSLPGKTA